MAKWKLTSYCRRNRLSILGDLRMDDIIKQLAFYPIIYTALHSGKNL
jgi:hypothetical protein